MAEKIVAERVVEDAVHMQLRRAYARKTSRARLVARALSMLGMAAALYTAALVLLALHSGVIVL
ncbi:MAG: hypothetical protein V3U18_04675 [Alphaproteobacteria bacterium]|jgi:hypothetical protein